MVVLWQLWQPFNNTRKVSRMTSKLTLLKIMFHILMFQQNDKQIDSLENHVPRINVPAKFNQDMSEFTPEHCNHLLRE
jgi:hypothetical protein